MKAEEMWSEYKKIHEGIQDTYQSWAFGVEPDLLATLVVKGTKTATASAYPLYELANEALPKVGEYDVILDGKGEAVCIILTTKVYVIPFGEVSAEHAKKEGEGDQSLEFWREVHRAFFTACLREAGQVFDETMNVVCEEFVVVFNG